MQILKVTPDILTQKFCLKKTWCTLKFENHCPQTTLDEIFDPVWFKLKDEKAATVQFHLYYFTHISYTVVTQSSKKILKSGRKENHTKITTVQFTEYPSNVFYFFCIIVIL